MKRSSSSTEEIQRFRQQLCGYEDFQLRMIHEYFTQDLTHILQELPTRALLVELKSRKVLDAEKYQSIKKQNGAEYFAKTLLQEILDLGREAVIGLWESLFALQKDHRHPNLLAALDEITHTGDSGYPCLPWLMTPILRPQGTPEDRYNKAHIKTRQVIEHCFGLLKMRFRCLDKSGGSLLYSPEKVVDIITAAAVLHNIAIKNSVDNYVPLQILNDEESFQQSGEHDRSSQGFTVRQQLIQNNFT